MDFSHAGYKGGGVRIPDVRVARTVKATAGRQHRADSSGHRRGVEASRPTRTDFEAPCCSNAGTYDVAGSLRIAASGVVLRGSGSGDDGTILRVTGAPHRVFTVAGTGTWQPDVTRATMTDAYVPAGASSVTVDSAASFRAGDAVVIQRAVDRSVDPLHEHGHARARRQAADVAQGRHGPHTRSDHRSRLRQAQLVLRSTCRLSDSFDAAYLNPPGTIRCEVHVSRAASSRSGVESLRVTRSRAGQAYQRGAVHVALDERRHRRMGARRRVGRHPEQHDVRIDRAQGDDRRRCSIQHTLPFTAAAAPADFAISGTQILLDRSSVTGEGVWPVVTQVGVIGPNVVLNFKSTTAGIAPHQRWATGLLVDSSEFTGGTDLPAEHRVLESRERRIGPWMERRLGRRVERKGRSAAHSAAARLEELVHRVHRPVHADPVAQAIRFPFRRARRKRTSLRECL